MNLISSKNNPKIKDVHKLFCSSKYRSQNGLFVVEGLRLCVDALRSNVEIKSVFITESFLKKFEHDAKIIINKSDETFIITDEILKFISDTVSPQGIVCVCRISKNSFNLSSKYNIAVLFNIADPSNLGTISRTTEAFGIDGMIVCGGCDIYNPKALRASMGALFRLPVIELNEYEAFDFFAKNNITTYASTPRTTAKNVTEIKFANKSAMLIGNEANGLFDNIIDRCDYSVTIPMTGRAESLNAAAAASVLLFEMVRDSK